MEFAKLQQLCLDALEVPDGYSLGRMRPYRDRITDRRGPGFETLESCWAEDARRARALRDLPRQLCEGVFECNPSEIASLLEQGVADKQIPKHPASAAYMHGRRLALLGSILKLIHHNMHDDLGFFRITHPSWRLDLREQWFPPAIEEEDSFDRLLSGVRLWDFPGFLIAFLGGVYDQPEKKIQFTWNGVCGDVKLRAFKILLTVHEELAGNFDICLDSVGDLTEQLLDVNTRSH